MNSDRPFQDVASMFEPSSVEEQNFLYFLAEAQDLLQTIEQNLLTLKEERTTAKIHELMRSAHTLKGAAASVNSATIKEVSHVLEDIFKALYNPEIELDAEVEALLFEGYECLRLPLMAEITGGSVDDSDILNRAASIFAQLQDKFGDIFNPDAIIPSSEELGFDVVQSMFEVGVEQRLQQLHYAIAQGNSFDVAALLRNHAEVLKGLAESVSLPGFQAIAETTLQALNTQPDYVLKIAQIALKDFRRGQAAVLAGDRNQGGRPSEALCQWANRISNLDSHPLEDSSDELELDFHADLQALLGNITDEDVAALDLEPRAGGNDINLQDGDDTQIFHDLLDLNVEAEVGSLKATSTGMSHIELTDDQANRSSFLSDDDRHLSDLFSSLDVDEPITSSQSSPPQDSPQTPLHFSIHQPSIESPPPKMPSTPSPSLSQPSAAVETEKARDLHSTLDRARATTMTESSSTPSPNPTARSTSTIRVDLQQLEHLNHLTGEMLINHNQQNTQQDQLESSLQGLINTLNKHQQTLSDIQDWSDQMVIRSSVELTIPTALRFSSSWNQGSRERSIPSYFQTSSTALPGLDLDTLEMDRYSDLHVLVQVALSETAQIETAIETIQQIRQQSHRTLASQRRLLTHVRDDLTHARMRSLGHIFQRFPGVLRQLSAAHGKPVNLTLKGAEVLVDKAIAESLYDPLLHLIRNAFDHGIETPDIRRSRGKPEEGQIELRAYHQGNRTIIEVHDDGQGTNLQRIAQRAVEMNLVSADDARNLSETEILQFLFKPGFSTNARLSDLSGRGVGLDVVHSQIQSMKGQVSIQSIPQQGTTFTLKIPFSLTITKLLVFRANHIAYAIPVESVERVLFAKTEQLQITSGNQRVLHCQINQQEVLVPTYQPSELVTYPSAIHHYCTQTATTSKDQELKDDWQDSSILLIRRTQGWCGLWVDQVLGEQELVIRPLGEAIAPPSYVYGCCILGDSNIALAIDPELLVQSSLESLLPSGSDSIYLTSRASYPALPMPAAVTVPQSLPPSVKTTAPILLVVDDSLTLRRALTHTLTQAGYEVLQARDGQEAIERLKQNSRISLVICDIEMPRVNGFEFLNQTQQDPHLAKIPIIMLTSRSGDKHRQIALALGASDYVTKPYSDVGLLSVLEDILFRKS